MLTPCSTPATSTTACCSPSFCTVWTTRGIRCSGRQGRTPRPKHFCATPTPISPRSSRPCANTGCRSAIHALADYCLRGCSCRLPSGEELLESSASAISRRASDLPLREPQKEDLAPFRLPTTPPVSPHQQGGRLRSDWVVAFHRNRWPLCLGFRTRLPQGPHWRGSP
jgi:hypothetical protein